MDSPSTHQNEKVPAMSAMKALVGKKLTKKVNFMEEEVEIIKMSVSAVMAIQAEAKDVGEDESANFTLLQTVIKRGCLDAEELTSEDFNQFPLDELSNLSNEIMRFSGVAGEQKTPTVSQ